MADKTRDWELYEAGKNFNNRIEPNYYDTVDTNWGFFAGDQWRNLKDTKLPKPVFNIIKRAITFFVASLTSSSVKINFEPLLYIDNQEDQEQKIADIANQKVMDLLEKFKFESKVKDALFDAAITGDACAHFIWDQTKKPYGTTYPIQGEISMELVDGTNVMFGNGNNADPQAQPYIIISGRDMVQNLREEAKRYQQPDNDITSDVNYGYEAGDNAKIEVDADEYGKALYIIVYKRDKETGTIKVSKSVETSYIYKDIDTGLRHYPVAWLNWEKQKNLYHGRAICTGMLPNQIFINRMFAMVMYHLMMTSFPKAVYNRDYISHWTNGVGEAIPIDGAGPELNINNIATYLKPGDMSNQIVQTIDHAMNYTKETLGINDTMLGNVKPDNTSAIIATQKSASIPLENPKANLYQWIEDIGQILFDMMGNYYGVRPMVRDVQGQKQIEMVDFGMFKDAWLNVKADVGEASYWSEIATMQTLDNLLNSGHIDMIDYLERIPSEYIPKKDELISKLQGMMQQQADQQAQYEQMAQFMESLPPDVQKQLQALPPDQMEATIMQMMQQPKPM